MYTIENESDYKFDFDYEELIEKVIDSALEAEGCPYEAEVSVTITDNASIQEINKLQRNIDSPTDVLSFPFLEYEIPGNFDFLEDDDLVSAYFNPDSGELTLGDIVISYEKVLSQAEEYGHEIKRELAFLVAHSMMHLFGYDHETEEEAKEMFAKQEAVLSKLGIVR
ncbi:MAG: rRNA maturation RNase YbeY [Parasporobacterium sp.]|nr:rRNA maturation RNase YbeY [Parasporobacterium sp.]